jgi:dihydrofolate reductase
MILSGIVAVAQNGVIGRDGGLPWRLSDDLKRFKALTMGHTIVMGRKTFESIGRALPGRRSIVLTRDRSYQASGALVVHSLDEALDNCRNEGEAFVIGGAALFSEALPRIQRLYLTRVEAQVSGDVRFPEVDWSQWDCERSEPLPADEKNEYSTTFQVYSRKTL